MRVGRVNRDRSLNFSKTPSPIQSANRRLKAFPTDSASSAKNLRETIRKRKTMIYTPIFSGFFFFFFAFSHSVVPVSDCGKRIETSDVSASFVGAEILGSVERKVDIAAESAWAKGRQRIGRGKNPPPCSSGIASIKQCPRY